MGTKMRKNHLKPVLSLLYFLPLTTLFIEMASAQNITVPVNVGVVLDFDVWVGKMGLNCINMALSDFYATHGHYKTRLVINSRDSKTDVIGAAAAALDLIKNVEVQAIIGPATSMQADFVIDLGAKAQVPVISFSASSPTLTSTRSPYFFRATQNDSTQAKAISAIVQAFGWREAIPIYVNNEYGEGMIPYLTNALQAINIHVPYQSAISPSATDVQIVEELYKLMTMQTRVFIVHLPPNTVGPQLFTKAKEIGMMSEGYVWIMTDGMTGFLNSMDPSIIDSMQGVLGIKPYISRTKELENFRVRWKRRSQQEPDMMDIELNTYGLWAYDATIALAIAMEKVGATNVGFTKAIVSSNSTDLETFGVSQNGPNLLQALSNTSFKGLTGNFQFVDGQLPPSAFQIVNVNGEGARGIGFWTPAKGLIRNLRSKTNTTAHSTSNSSLAHIVWPGDSNSVPKGWEIPTNGKKLRIGVPIKDGFSEFVTITRDPSTNTTKVTGYSIAVFDAVVEALPYALPYEYIPFAKPDGQMAGTYNDLVDQVYLGHFDAVVGDVTIIANRASYVDFTLPYTESGVSMIVPIQNSRSKNAWVFLKPLTWDLWVTSFCFFCFIGFVVWVLEHRINEDFRGPPLHQVGTSFWFSFSTMVFAQRERVVSNLARFVIIIWCLVVLVLTQSYTASLTSLLTVQQLQPAVTDVRELIKRGEFVGYQDGSFVLGILQSLGFDKAKLRTYNSTEECDELFTKGSENGGIAAAFDEVPYMKLFLAQYCSKYTMIEPTFKTDGFGFVFPKGSILVPDISSAILKVTEGDKMREIEKAWFGKQSNCPDPSTSVSSSSLGLDSFWGLFLIVGVASLSALAIFIAMFLYAHREVLMPPTDSKPLMWRRILDLFRIFDQRDLKSHTFQKGEAYKRNVFNFPTPSMGAPTPSTFSIYTDFPREQGASSPENDGPNANGQAPPDVVINIELVNPIQERMTAT